MQSWTLWLFGEGSHLAVGQMVARAVVIFLLALLMIRASGRRSFGQRGTFDACLTVLLGAVLSRAVVGASPFWATVAAAAVLALMHRALALACIRWPGFEDLVSGREIVLVQDGILDPAKMRQALLTERNLAAAVRQKLGEVPLSEVERAMLERDGKITVIGRERRAGEAAGSPALRPRRP